MNFRQVTVLCCGLAATACQPLEAQVGEEPGFEAEASSELASANGYTQRSISNPNALFNGAFRATVNKSITSPDAKLSLRQGANPNDWVVSPIIPPPASKLVDGTLSTNFVDSMLGLDATLGAPDGGPTTRDGGAVWPLSSTPNFQMGLAHDPRMPGGVPSLRVATVADCLDAGTPAQVPFTPTGEFECHHLIVVMASGEAPNPGMKHALLAVATKAYDTQVNGGGRLPAPTQVAGRFTRVFAELRSTDGTVMSGNIEVSMTADGRLLNGNKYYAYSETPWLPEGWTRKGPIKNIYTDAADASTQLCLDVQGSCVAKDKVDFHLKYPLAAYPFRNAADGSEHQADTETHVNVLTYPWLTFDGTELFGNQFRYETTQYHGRGMRSVAGKATQGVLRHIDNQINLTRNVWCVPSDGGSEVSPLPYNVPIVGERNNCAPDSPFVGVQTTQPLGTATGFWRLFPEYTRPMLPLAKRSTQYMMLQHHQLLQNFGTTDAGWFNTNQDAGKATALKVYGEVSLDDTVDGHYLVSMHMNELVAPNTNNGTTMWVGAGGATSTPDTSGNFYTGVFGGPALPKFPFEREDNKDVPGKVNVGFLGRAVYFKGGSKLSSAKAGGPLDETHEQLTVELAFKSLTTNNMGDGGVVYLASQPRSWELYLNAANKLTFRAARTNTTPPTPPTWATITTTAAVSYSPDTFTHVAVTAVAETSTSMKVTMYVDGKPVQTATWTNPIATPGFAPTHIPKSTTGDRICVGPYCNWQGVGGQLDTEVLLIDEVAVSDVARSPDELAVASFTTASSTVSLERSEAEGPYLFRADGKLDADNRQGLKAKDLRIPSAFLDRFITLPASDRNTRFAKIAALGSALFRDDLLTAYSDTATGAVVEAKAFRSCATCHKPGTPHGANAGVAFDLGIQRQTTTTSPMLLNTPVIHNRFFGKRQFFDQRANDLRDQVLKPVSASFVTDAGTFFEMGGDVATVVAFINDGGAGAKNTVAMTDADDGFPAGVTPPAGVTNYLTWFRDAFGTGVNDLTVVVDTNMLADALVAHLGAFTSADSVVDKMQRGVPTGLSSVEDEQLKRGHLLFNGKARCSACHNGSNLSDELMHASGPSGELTKTPSLRFINDTAPFFKHAESPSMPCRTNLPTAHIGLCRVVSFYNEGGKLVPNGYSRSVSTDMEIFPLGLTDNEIVDLVFYLSKL